MITSVKEILISLYLYDSHHKDAIALVCFLSHQIRFVSNDDKMRPEHCLSTRLLLGLRPNQSITQQSLTVVNS